MKKTEHKQKSQPVLLGGIDAWRQRNYLTEQRAAAASAKLSRTREAK